MTRSQLSPQPPGSPKVTRRLRVAVAVAAAAFCLPLGGLPPSTAVTTAVTAVTASGSCPTTSPSGTLRDGSASVGGLALCRHAVAAAATPQAALAIAAAFHMLGAPYACGGVGRMAPFRFDCSSLVSRAYFLGAGLDTAGVDWAPSTRDMVPWDGVRLASWAALVTPANLRPGDLVLYDTGGATYRHVVMYLGDGYMLHTNSCGDVAHVSAFWGTGPMSGRRFLVARRVMAPADYRPPTPSPTPVPIPSPVPAPRPSTVTPPFPGGTVGLGARGQVVVALQRSLIRGGYLHPEMFGAITSGRFGTQTRDAVVAFQFAHPTLGSASGVVGAAAYRAITGWGAASTGAPGPSAEVGRPVLSVASLLGRSRPAVRVVQAGLNRVVGVEIAVDGLWGPRTQAAYTVFRRHMLGLVGRAALGPPTRASLVSLGRMSGFTVVS